MEQEVDSHGNGDFNRAEGRDLMAVGVRWLTARVLSLEKGAEAPLSWGAALLRGSVRRLAVPSAQNQSVGTQRCMVTQRSPLCATCLGRRDPLYDP